MNPLSGKGRMNYRESRDFVRKYFDELFGCHNVDALDEFLDGSYFDDDIGDPNVDHIMNSKEFLKDLFMENPTIGVNVLDTITHDNVISSFVEWYVIENDKTRIIRKGIVILVVHDQRIHKRHTFIYYEG